MKQRQIEICLFPVRILFTSFFLIFSASCVSIKPSTVDLSVQVGERLSEMERLHQLAVQRYFDVEKQKIEDFLTNTWEPLFLKNFLGTSGVIEMLQNVSKIDDGTKNILSEGISAYVDDPLKVEGATNDLMSQLNVSRKQEDGLVRSVLTQYVENSTQLEAAVIHISSLLGTDEAARIIFEFTEAAHQEMQSKREELLAPLEQLRAETAAELSAAYAELIRGQSTITGRLEAASKRSEQQDVLLNKLGVAGITNDITNRLTGFSSDVNVALGVANNALSQGDGNAIEGAFNTLKSSLNSATTPTPANKN